MRASQNGTMEVATLPTSADDAWARQAPDAIPSLRFTSGTIDYDELGILLWKLEI